MANIYRMPVLILDRQTGLKVKSRSRKWWGRYRAANGRDTRVPLATDRAAAQAMLNELVRKAEREAAGLEDPFDKHHTDSACLDRSGRPRVFLCRKVKGKSPTNIVTVSVF